MKNIFIVSLLFSVLILPSCKKDNTTNSPANAPRTGLGSLVDPNATSYCVVILDYGDTLIWSNTKGDGYRGYGGVSGSSGGDLYFTSFGMSSKTIKNLWRRVGMQFQMHENHGYSNPACGYVDSLIQVGPFTQSTNSVYFSLSDSTGAYFVLPYFNTNTSTSEVVSKTVISSSTGCYSLRTKVTFSNLNLDTDPFCAAFHTRVIKGELQMDFNVQ